MRRSPSSPLYIVQSIPERRSVRERLLAQLPPAVVVEDDGPQPPNPWRGYQLCLSRIASSDATHGVVIQDDAILCENFEGAIANLIEVIPNNLVCLFYPGLRMRSGREMQAAVRNKRNTFVLNRQDFLPVVAVLWPKEKASFLLKWVEARRIPGLRYPYRSDDAVAGSWMRHTKQDVFVTIPSLVQHPDDVPSSIGKPARSGADKGRVAFAFCEGDPLQISWRI